MVRDAASMVAIGRAVIDRDLAIVTRGVGIVIVRGVVVVVVRGVVVVVFVVRPDDRAVGGVRVIVTVGRQVQVRQHLEPEEPQHAGRECEPAAVS